MVRHFFSRQFIAFLLVGGSAAFLNWLSRIILSNWMSFHWAVVGAYLIGVAYAFILNSLFVFPNSVKSRGEQALNFILVNLLFLPIVWIASIAIDKILNFWDWHYYNQAIAHGIAVAIPAFATFLIYKFFIFSGAKKGHG